MLHTNVWLRKKLIMPTCYQLVINMFSICSQLALYGSVATLAQEKVTIYF